MKSKSCKAKGRVLQDYVRDHLRRITTGYNLQDEDIKPQPMGQKGVDTILSPAARAVIDFDVECKNTERCNLPTVFWKHFKKYVKTPGLKLLFSKRNRTEPLVTMRAEDFFTLYEELLSSRKADPYQPTTYYNSSGEPVLKV